MEYGKKLALFTLKADRARLWVQKYNEKKDSTCTVEWSAKDAESVSSRMKWSAKDAESVSSQ